MITRLSKHGDELVLAFDRSLLKNMRIGEHTALEVTTHGRALVISPADDRDFAHRLERALEIVNQRDAETLQRLA